MRKILLTVVCHLIASIHIVSIGTAAILIPGESTKKDADNLYGAPNKDIFARVRYEYAPIEHVHARLLVTFDPETETVVAVNLFFKETQNKAVLTEQYGLAKPDRISFDTDDKLIEYYSAAGISLHYNGKTDDSSIFMVRVFEKQLLPEAPEPKKLEVKERIDLAQESGVVIYTQDVMKEIGNVKSLPPIKPKQVILIDESKKDTIVQKTIPSEAVPVTVKGFGVQIQLQNEKGIQVLEILRNSPAERAGLSKGDLILKVGDVSFDPKKATLDQFVETITRIPMDKPVLFLIERSTKRFELSITPTEKESRPQIEEKTKSQGSPEKPQAQLHLPPKGKPLTRKEKTEAPVLIEKDNKKAGEKDSGTKVSLANKKRALPKSTVIFEDNFDEDNSGRGHLRYRGFSKWYVPLGEVDLLGNSFGAVFPGHGLYVDLAGTQTDGTDKNLGMLQSRQTLELAAGRYNLSFDLMADGADKRVKMSVWLGRLGNVYKKGFVGNKEVKFERRTAEFKLRKKNRCKLSFVCRDAQNSVLIDNIKFERFAD